MSLMLLFASTLPLVVPRAQESASLLDAPLVTLDLYDRYAFLTDLDQDGFQDAVSWWWTNPEMDHVRLRAWRNDGTGRLVVRWALTVELSQEARNVRVFPCQVDSDGLTDIGIEAYSGATAMVRVVRSHGLAYPELLTSYSITEPMSPWPGFHASVIDFTGDGLADLAYSNGASLKLMEFVPGEPALVLRSTSMPFGTLVSTVDGLLEIDANGDATPDVLAWRGSTMQMIEVQDCQPSATRSYTQGILDHHMPAVGDIDGDGDRDLVIWNNSRFVVLRRQSPAGWSVEPPILGGPAEFLFDVDRDGDLDGVCCGGSGGPSTPVNKVESMMRVSINDGTGRFAPSLEIPWLGSDHLAGIADLDHDGDLDVVSGRCILYARGPLDEELRPAFGAQQSPRTIADIDGDGDPDFSVGLDTLKRNLGDGRLEDHTANFPPPPAGTQFVGPGWSGDFDGDGDVDLVVKKMSGATFLAHHLLANRGGGSFEDAGQVGPDGVHFNMDATNLDSPDASLVADADGDGDLDLITRGRAGGSYRSLLWWNDGTGHFTAGPEIQGEYLTWVGDLDGNGIPDLAGSWLAHDLATYGYLGWNPGLGGGSFGARIQLSPASHLGVSFAVADLDSDGDLDVAIAFQFNLNLYWNDGSGAFTPQAVLSGFDNGDLAHNVKCTDLNGDGRLDLLVTGSSVDTGCLIMLRRKDDNTGWRAAVSQVVSYGSYPPDATLCDVDGDGDQDYLTDRLIWNGEHTRPRGGARWQTGTGTPGSGGLAPTLGAVGPFRPGESNQLRVRGGRGGAPGVVRIVQVDGGQRGPGGWIAPVVDRFLITIPFVLSGTRGEAGAGSWTLPFTVPASFASQTHRYVAEILDPEAAGGIARANTLRVCFGE